MGREPAWRPLKPSLAGNGPRHRRPSADLRLAAAPMAVAAGAVASLGFPSLALPVALAGVALAGRRLVDARRVDPGKPIPFLLPDDARHETEVGATHFGNEIGSGRELWLSAAAMRSHVLVLGGEAADRSAVVDMLAFNAVSEGSGFAVVDTSGTREAADRAAAIAARFGREDDLLVLDLRHDPGPTHKLNPLHGLVGARLAWMIGALAVPPADRVADPESAAHVDALAALMAPAIALGEAGEPTCARSVSARIDPGEGLGDGHALSAGALARYRAAMCGDARDTDKGYALGMARQARAVATVRGALAAYVDTPAGPFAADAGDVDMADTWANRRLLTALLPPLGAAGHDAMGLVVLAMLRNAMGTMLSDERMPGWGRNLTGASTAGPTPFLVAFDGPPACGLDSLDMMAAQARAMGLCMAYAVPGVSDVVARPYRPGRPDGEASWWDKATSTPRPLPERTYPPDPDTLLDGRGRLQGWLGQAVAANANTTIALRCLDPATARMAVGRHGKPDSFPDLRRLAPGQAAITHGSETVVADLFLPTADGTTTPARVAALLPGWADRPAKEG